MPASAKLKKPLQNQWPSATISENPSSGQFLIEVVIAVGVLLIYTHAFFTLITTSYQILSLSRAESMARALANEKMEIIRNLPYDDVGTMGGIPNGSLPQEETNIRNGQTFTVNTSVVYIDDPFDNLAPSDTLPIDYKSARIQVNWSGNPFTNDHLITLITTIAPKGVESTTGGGTLSILVFNSLGLPVAQAQVHIQANTAAPPVDLIQFTDDLGNLILPGAPACTACYHITVTKSGYSTDRTYTTAEVPNPNLPPFTILEGQVTPASFAIDQLSQITFNSTSTRENNYQDLGNVDFHLQGSKTIGTDTEENPIYKLDQNLTTETNGQLTLDLEWDNYIITLDQLNYDLGGSQPFSPLTVNAGDNATLRFIGAPHQDHNLLTLIQNPAGNPIPSALVRLTGLDFDGTLYSGTADVPDFGQTFFSPLDHDLFSLEISHDEYLGFSGTIDVTDQTQTTVILNPK